MKKIVVTARGRDESLQNVPTTVDAFTAQTIQQAGIEPPRVFVAMVPNMTNKIYAAEFCAGGFLWRAPPRRYGVDFTLKF